LRVFAINDADGVAPALVDLDHAPLDLRRDVTEKSVGGRMGAQAGSDEIEKRWRVGEFAAGEVTIAEKAAIELVPANADPVVEALEREVDVFVGLQFEDGEATVEGAGENVDHSAVGRGEGGHLRVPEARIEALVDGADVTGDEGFEPTFGTEAEERIAAVATRIAAGGEASDQIAEAGFVGVVEGVLGEPES